MVYVIHLVIRFQHNYPDIVFLMAAAVSIWLCHRPISVLRESKSSTLKPFVTLSPWFDVVDGFKRSVHNDMCRV